MKQDWEVKKLGEVLSVQNGYAFDSKLFTSDKGLPLIRIRDIKNGYTTEINYSGVYDNKYIVKAGDLLIGMDGEFRCFEWKGEKALLNQRVCRLQDFKQNLHPRFLFYGINKYLKEIEDVTSFATVKHISSKQIQEIEFPFPSISEQKRIVAILDKAFAAIDKAKANTEKNLQNVRELFESYLQNVFRNTDVGWEQKMLGEVCSLITDGKHGDCKNELNSGYYFLSAKDVRNGTLLFENARQITKSDFEETHRRTNLKPGDICMVNTGATIGRISFAPNDERTYRSTFQKSVAVIKTINTLIDSKYCCYVLQSDLKKLVKISSGTAVPNLLLGDIKRHKINLPKSLASQRAISQKLDTLSLEVKRMEQVYQQKMDVLEELGKRILQKAIIGDL